MSLISKESEDEKILLPHHEQQPLCTSRLPYRQGRKLTAVKVYTINNESSHLLIFNVPTLNLRQETKSLFSKFGKVSQFNLTNGYKTEKFTEVYHVSYERIQCARFAKKMTDCKGFYGEVLHVCYAPEFESLEETKQKLLQRRYDVLKRLNSIHKDKVNKSTKEPSNNGTVKQNELEVIGNDQVVQHNNTYYENHSKECSAIINEVDETCLLPENISKINNTHKIVKNPIKYIEDSKKMYMGEENTIVIGKTRKRKQREKEMSFLTDKSTYYKISIDNTEIVDCTNVDKETITNINEHLNYNKFGNEIVKKIAAKPVNKIRFNKKD